MGSMKKTASNHDLDPSIYLYDEVYDDIKQENSVFGRDKRSKGLHQAGGADEPEAPKFLPGLLKNAELRKKDKERRKFRHYAREREDENPEEFKDKEVFVTASYKDRLKYIEQIESEKVTAPTNERQSTRKNDVNEPSSSSTVSNQRTDEQPHDEQPYEHYDQTNDILESTATLPIKEPVDREKVVREKLAKRTVGAAFDEAVARYRARKNSIEVHT